VNQRPSEAGTVPLLIGMGQAPAKGKAELAGYHVTVTTAISNRVPAGLVLAQSPVAGSALPQGETIELTVAAAVRGE
jgi:beta-lactam-binding protein with PASTA domain